MAARIVHMPTPNEALDPVPSLLTLFLTIPKETKSVTITTRVMIHATAATTEANMAPMKPDPRARRKAMNATPQAIGWRIMTRVRPLAVSPETVEKPVPSMEDMMAAGSYPMVLLEQ